MGYSHSPLIVGTFFLRDLLTTESEGNIPAIALASDSIKRDRNTAWLLGFEMLLSQPLA